MPKATQLLLPVLAAMALVHAYSSAEAAPCDDIADLNLLRILSINLLFSEVDDRKKRLQNIAKLVTNQKIDVVLLQEVSRGRLIDSSNTSRTLSRMIKARGQSYHRQSVLKTGVSGLLKVGNAILSRCRIVEEKRETLPRASEFQFAGVKVKLRRVAQMVRIEVPNFRRVNVYNTHLCAACSHSELKQQTKELLKFVDKVEKSYSPDNPVILGGDFNMNRLRNKDHRDLYNRIVGAGFIDAYAQSQTDGLDALCDKYPADGSMYPDKHCTIGEGVTSLSDSEPKRIDYIFTRNFGLARKRSQVVFNPLVIRRLGAQGQMASDHAGVVVRVSLR